MEEGSLLQEALQGRQGTANLGDENGSTCLLLLDVYSLEIAKDTTQHLLLLAQLATQCNQFVQSLNFHWHYGGDGPVFGVHVGEHDIPHLRAYCRYGPNVPDEWMAIDVMVQLSDQLDVAISCWDVEDGQVILIQGSDQIPDTFDEDPTDNHRYACWIRRGKVQLLEQSHISLPVALQQLRKLESGTATYPRLQSSLERWLQDNREMAFAKQRTPFVVPRTVATLMEKRPDLVHMALQSFCDNIDLSPPSLSTYEDWVWTTHEISRTNYAMCRTMVSSEWTTPEFVPPAGVEVKRYKRQCAVEATPHIQHAVQFGVRLVAGLEFLLTQKPLSAPSTTENRVARWTRLGNDCQPPSGDWVLESFQQGPNHSIHNLDHVLRCPVFPEEWQNPSLHSHPETSMKQQIQSEFKRADLDRDYPMPRADQVDDESWLALEEGGNGEGNDLDAVLSRFQNFMVQPSGVEGVDTAVPVVQSKPKEIRPRVVLNILHAVLKGDDLQFPTKDEFFYDEDYDLMEADENDTEQVQEMKGLMDAMDKELTGKTKSRDLDSVEDLPDSSGAPQEVKEDAHVLSNLLQSLEASHGTAGPVPNMLKEMGSELHE